MEMDIKNYQCFCQRQNGSNFPCSIFLWPIEMTPTTKCSKLYFIGVLNILVSFLWLDIRVQTNRLWAILVDMLIMKIPSRTTIV